jgi:polyphenol oxidase
MLRRVEHENGVVTYQSDLLRDAGVRHAFSTRIGGVSAAPYDTLNLGYLTKGTAPDHNTDVSENFRRLRRAVGLERRWRVQVTQVHGAEVYIPDRPRRLRDTPAADAMVSDITGAMLTVRTADCVPLLLASRDGRTVAAVHAGWRGILAGVVAGAVGAMQQRFDVSAGRMLAAIGPAIGVERYEVGEEVAAQFESGGWRHTVHRAGYDRPHIDLSAAVRMQLQATGLRDEAIDSCTCCTHRDAAEFFSYRRDRARTGHMAAVIAATA